MLRLTFASLALATSLPVLAQTVSDIVPQDPTRSGLVRVTGSGFGGESGARLILVVDRPAAFRSGSQIATVLNVPVARWSDALLEVYVPEQAPVGKSRLILDRQGQQTVLGVLTVRPRPLGNGRLKWRFTCADQFVFAKPAVGPDGTVYAMGNYGHLYAIAPDGGLRWVLRPVHGVHGCVSVGQDGTVFLGGAGVQAVSPDGTVLWHYPLNTPLVCGPNVGPDGRVYAVDNSRWSSNVQGVVVLSPTGQLVSSGGRYYERGAGDRALEIVFDTQNAYFTSAGSTANGEEPGLSAIHLGGGKNWVNRDGLLGPASHPGGGAVILGTSSISRLSAAGGQMWSRSLWDWGGYQPKEGVVTLTDGSSFWMQANNRIIGLDTNGANLANISVGETPSDLAATPDGRLLVETYSNFGVPTHIRAYSRLGQFLFQSEDLPLEQGTAISVWNGIATSRDSQWAYFGSAGPMDGAGVAHCYVFGMSLQ